MSADLLRDADWACTAVAAGAASTPDEVKAADSQWYPATVPGTAAAAVRAGHGRAAALARDYDAEDWWFLTNVRVSGSGPWLLTAEGLATVAEVWVDGVLVARSESMFLTTTVALGGLPAECTVALRFAALGPLLAQRRRPRARWHTALAREQGLRWWRTSLLGRAPLFTGTAAPVGPYRAVRLCAREPVEVVSRSVRTSVRGSAGVLQLSARLRTHGVVAGLVQVSVGSVVATVDLQAEGEELVLQAEISVADVALWWPHTHGGQPLYPLAVEVAGHRLDWGTVGFRDIAVDRSGGGFALSVNGVEVFCRGACWTPVDPLGLVPASGEVRATLLRAREAGFTVIRVTGTMLYEDTEFWSACAELGLLVWQDAMLSTLDPPDDPQFIALVSAEIEQLCSSLQGNPALAVFSGGSETEQQPALLGLPPERRAIDAIEKLIPAIVARMVPGTPYVTSSPSGGALPTHVGTGVAHYFGVGAYLRPLSDLRTSGVRFAAECLAFAIPPERHAVEEFFGSAAVAGHHPLWKAAVPRDHGASWDFEDVRDHYLRKLFGVEPATVRRADPQRYLDLGRAAVCEAMGAALGYWRRDPRCGGALVLSLRDLEPGAGWGLLDAAGEPKAPYYVLRRLCQPVAVLVADEGLDGMRIDMVNEHPKELTGTLTVTGHRLGGAQSALAEVSVEVAARSSQHWSIDELAGAFLDLNHAYKFGPQTYDALTLRLRDVEGREIAAAVYLLGEHGRALQPDVGLTATVTDAGDGRWTLVVATRETAQYVCIDVDGYCPEDSWFHLAGGTQRSLALYPRARSGASPARPVGVVRALNSVQEASVVSSQ